MHAVLWAAYTKPSLYQLSKNKEGRKLAYLCQYFIGLLGLLIYIQVKK